ncbi:MAG TPA: endolytic transglycosylase MltG [Methyloceanibacter sp.]|nr:endolytic transglycosylase MltG [Methyloceanibacter sp.]
MTSDLSSTANDDGARERAERAMRNFATPPRSPYEALEPGRPPEFPEREPWRMHPVLAFFNALFMLTLFTACVVLALFYFLKIQFDRPGPLPASTVVVVPKGEGVSGIAERLERDEVITDRGMFMTSIIYFMYLRGAGALKAGEYEFKKAASMRQVLDTLVEGKSIDHKVTLAEGLTSQQIVERIQANPDLKGTLTEIPAEGTLLPDTYRFQIGDSRQDIIERMQVGQKKFLAKMWEERDPDIVVQTPEEAVILASIVEKETSRADERPLIASVFQNRLRKKMRLQSDPTIIYGLVGGKGVLDHPILQEELDRETAYNTYKINGLPPGPIANPGRAAIEAVLKPAKTKDLYFVADGTGGHAFAPSLDAHNDNVARWRQIERAKREQERAEAAAAAAAGQVPADGAAPKNGAAGAPAPGALVDPDVPPDGQSSAGVSAAQGAAPAGEAEPAPEGGGGGNVPLPKRNPLR